MSKKPSPPAPLPKARGVQKLFGRKSLAFGRGKPSVPGIIYMYVRDFKGDSELWNQPISILLPALYR